jgi:hypothetical protein
MPFGVATGKQLSMRFQISEGKSHTSPSQNANYKVAKSRSEGAQYDSPGQRPGFKKTRYFKPQRGGIGLLKILFLLRPFRARIMINLSTQGVALGYYIEPLSGQKQEKYRGTNVQTRLH